MRLRHIVLEGAAGRRAPWSLEAELCACAPRVSKCCVLESCSLETEDVEGEEELASESSETRFGVMFGIVSNKAGDAESNDGRRIIYSYWDPSKLISPEKHGVFWPIHAHSAHESETTHVETVWTYQPRKHGMSTLAILPL